MSLLSQLLRGRLRLDSRAKSASVLQRNPHLATLMTESERRRLDAAEEQERDENGRFASSGGASGGGQSTDKTQRLSRKMEGYRSRALSERSEEKRDRIVGQMRKTVESLKRNNASKHEVREANLHLAHVEKEIQTQKEWQNKTADSSAKPSRSEQRVEKLHGRSKDVLDQAKSYDGKDPVGDGQYDAINQLRGEIGNEEAADSPRAAEALKILDKAEKVLNGRKARRWKS